MVETRQSSMAGSGGEAARKINLMILASSLWIGGAETVIRHLAESIDRKRFNVTVCHLKHRGHVGDELAKAGVDIVGLPGWSENGGKPDYFTSLKLRRLLREKRIDVLHAHTTHALMDAALCKLMMPGLKVVNTFHFGNYPHTRSRLMWMERIFSRVCDRLFAVGETQRSQLKAVYGFSERRIEMIWNGVTRPSQDGDPSFRRRVGAEGRLLIGTLATLIKQKGLFDLLAVARLLKDRGHTAKFVVIGEGLLRPELEARRSLLGLDDDVAFTGWMTSAAETALPLFDVLFQPSLWEAMSVVILEAMMAGKAIVATRVGENPYVLSDDVDGLLVPAGDIDAMAGALERVVVDSALRTRLGEAARFKGEQSFSVEHMARAYERVYEEVMQ